MAAFSVSGIPLGLGGSIFLGEIQSRIYPNMCAKFGCGPTVTSKGGGYKQPDKGTLQLYIVDNSVAVRKLQVAILAQSFREMSQIVRIE